MSEVTQVLALEQGENRAAEELLPLVYDELRRLAAWHLANERPGQTLQATALAHEAWLRLVGRRPLWEGRRLFFGAAVEAIRRILVENAGRKKCLKGGGQLDRVEFEGGHSLTYAKESRRTGVCRTRVFLRGNAHR